MARRRTGKKTPWGWIVGAAAGAIVGYIAIWPKIKSMFIKS